MPHILPLRRPLRAALRLALTCALGLAALPAAAEIPLTFGGATGGILRAPNTNQDEDAGNAFAEAWVKGDVELWRQGDTVLKGFVLGNYVRDTKPFAWNNTRKLGVGLSLSMRPIPALELTFSARHDWYGELKSDTRRKGWRYAVDYYFYKYWEAEPDTITMGLRKRATIFKSYGTLAYPGSLVEGDDNLVLTVGGEYSADYEIGQWKTLLTPFVDAHASWDKDGNNYNNKLIPALGVKLRRPIDKGELFAGVKYEVDYRWQDKTVDTGPMVFAGWYKGF